MPFSHFSSLSVIDQNFGYPSLAGLCDYFRLSSIDRRLWITVTVIQQLSVVFAYDVTYFKYWIALKDFVQPMFDAPFPAHLFQNLSRDVNRLIPKSERLKEIRMGK